MQKGDRCAAALQPGPARADLRAGPGLALGPARRQQPCPATAFLSSIRRCSVLAPTRARIRVDASEQLAGPHCALVACAAVSAAVVRRLRAAAPRAHAGGGPAAAAQLECGGGGGGGAPPARPARSAPPTFHARPAPARSARPSRTERRSARRDLATQRLRFGLCCTLCALRAMQRRRTPDGASRGPTGSPNGTWSRMTDYFVNAATGFRPQRKSVCTKVLPTVRSALLGPAVSRLRLGFRSRCWCCAKVGTGRVEFCRVRGTECSDYKKS